MTHDEQIEMERRLATLEANYFHVVKAIDEDREERKVQTAKLDTVLSKFEKYESRWGWVSMFLAAVGGAFIMLKDWIFESFGGRN